MNRQLAFSRDQGPGARNYQPRLTLNQQLAFHHEVHEEHEGKPPLANATENRDGFVTYFHFSLACCGRVNHNASQRDTPDEAATNRLMPVWAGSMW